MSNEQIVIVVENGKARKKKKRKKASSKPPGPGCFVLTMVVLFIILRAMGIG